MPTAASRHTNIGIGTERPQKAIHIYRETNPFIATAPASLRIENYNTGGISSEGIYYAWDFENKNNNLKLKFGNNSDKAVNNTETKFTFGSNGTLTAAKFVGDGSALTNLNIPEAIWQQSTNNISYVQGNVGIGTSNPTDKLEIDGKCKS